LIYINREDAPDAAGRFGVVWPARHG